MLKGRKIWGLGKQTAAGSLPRLPDLKKSITPQSINNFIKKQKRAALDFFPFLWYCIAYHKILQEMAEK